MNDVQKAMFEDVLKEAKKLPAEMTGLSKQMVGYGSENQEVALAIIKLAKWITNIDCRLKCFLALMMEDTECL